MRLVRSLRRPSASASLAFITYIDTTTYTYTVLPHDCPAPPLPTSHYGIKLVVPCARFCGLARSAIWSKRGRPAHLAQVGHWKSDMRN